MELFFKYFSILTVAVARLFCELSKRRLSIPLVEALNGPIDDNKELKVCGYSL